MEIATTTELQKITTGLESFEQRKQSLIDLAESAEHLAIASIDDTNGIKAVSTKRKELKAARVQIEKEGKAMRDLITPVSKHISAKEKELLSIIMPHEERLYAREQWVENEIEKIRAEKEAKEKQRIQDRIDQLAKYNVAIDYVMCLGLTDEQFTEKLTVAKSEFEAEQKKAEETKRRIQVLIDSGFSYDGNNYFVSDFKRIDHVTIYQLSQIEFEDIVKSGKNELIRLEAYKKAELDRLQKQKEEQEARQKELDEIEANQRKEAAKIAAERKAIDDEKKRIEDEKQAEINRKIREEELEKAKKEATEKALKDAEEKKLKEEQEKKEADRIAKEKEEKRIARMPDKEKLIEFADNIIFNTAIPVVNSEDAKRICSQAKIKFLEIVEFVKSETEKL